ncbi:hypothetical protein F4810DRAFT_726831 [Camillea tinctor]|nr:hypothetical protein F4810DRAFT_726831 [Camillea tinctor]
MIEFIAILQLRNITFCVITPLFGAYWSLYQTLTDFTGYHRLWSHRSFVASPPLKLFLAICGVSSAQGSIIAWCRDHRAHHRFIDTRKDPYNVQKGLLWSHMGWLIFKPDPKLIGWVDISDLCNDNVVLWQYRNLPIIFMFFGYILPGLIAHAGWRDGLGGLLYAGIIPHYLGDQPYADAQSPRDYIFTALLTFGEGYHNFHHEFPSDSWNGIRRFDYDPTKWLIRLWKWAGLASDLQEFPSNEISKAIFQQEEKRLLTLGKNIVWGRPLDTLPTYTWKEFEALCLEGPKSRQLICIAGVIHDIDGFLDHHPGGRALRASYVGNDATGSFSGGIYSHTEAARNLLQNMRFGVIQGGGKIDSI